MGDTTKVFRLKHVNALAAANTCGLLYALMGLLFGGIIVLMSTLNPNPKTANMFWFGLAAPFLYGALGWLFTGFGAWVYNLVASWTGGFSLEFEES